MRLRILLMLLGVTVVVAMTSGFSPVKSMDLPAPAISGKHWINSEPLSWDKLNGKVVLVEFWTFECYNCKHVEPHVKEWYQQFHPKGFQVVAVHSPEFERERDINNVRDYVNKQNIPYPVVIDNDFAIWQRFSNRYWPAMYLVDKSGTIRHRFVGEGNYSFIAKKIQELLAEQS